MLVLAATASRLAPASLSVVSRAEMQEIHAGRGIEDPDGTACVGLDLRHLGEERLPQIREVAIKFLGVDPAQEVLPVMPAAHFVMGGVHTDLRGATRSYRSS